MNIDYTSLGERIKTQRKYKGTTQEHFAEHLDVSVGYISQIERGITKVSLERLLDIAEYLECNTSFLLEGTALNDTNYLLKEFNELFQKFSTSEKKILIHLLREYFRTKNSDICD